VRDIAARTGIGTIYRHFPNRADLIVAVYQHQIDLFVDFLVTKHGLAKALQSEDCAFQALRTSFIERLVPVCPELLDAAAAAGEIRPVREPSN
jgi:AcrR family transcriptional regulator